MAERDCICKGCSISFSSGTRGRIPELCIACRGQRTARPGAPCAVCGALCEGKKSSARFCSHKCKDSARNVRRLSPGLRRLRGPFTCKCCGIEYCTRRKPGEGEAFCSRACVFAGVLSDQQARRKVVNSEIASLRAIKANWTWRPSALVLTETAALKRMARYVERPKLKRLQCADCSRLVIAPNHGTKFCSECIAAKTRIRNKAGKKTSSGRASKSKAKAIRRARAKINADSIDPIAVFRRDGWRCHICKVRTPQLLRGTFDDRAPELDHITTLADNGHHVWSNVACACRRCNIVKGARSMGQLNLGWVA